jgi:superfamily II DNA/RNA helicase
MARKSKRSSEQPYVVGPRRVLDHLLRGTLTLDSLAMLIFDEADRMLSMGFYPDMSKSRAICLPEKYPRVCFLPLSELCDGDRRRIFT